MPILRGGRGRRGGGWGTFLKLVKLLVEKFQKTPLKGTRILPVVGVPLNNDILYYFALL